jgi:hypothetical protein
VLVYIAGSNLLGLRLFALLLLQFGDWLLIEKVLEYNWILSLHISVDDYVYLHKTRYQSVSSHLSITSMELICWFI